MKTDKKIIIKIKSKMINIIKKVSVDGKTGFNYFFLLGYTISFNMEVDI